MANREQLVEREKQVSPLSNREIGEADERSSPSAKVIHEAIRLEGYAFQIETVYQSFRKGFRIKEVPIVFPDRKVGRREFWRGMLRETPAGLAVDKFARDGSGLISGLRAADGLIDIPEDVPEVKLGDPVAFIPFAEFGIVGR